MRMRADELFVHPPHYHPEPARRLLAQRARLIGRARVEVDVRVISRVRIARTLHVPTVIAHRCSIGCCHARSPFR